MIDEIREAFQKVKEDISSLGEEINQIRFELADLKTDFKLISSYIDDLRKKELENSTKPLTTDKQKITTDKAFSTTQPDFTTDNLPPKPLKTPNIQSSIGNQGVTTDRQTDRQTDTYAEKAPIRDKISHIDKASEILASLNGLKRELRQKFKKLTEQEMKVFSLIYQLEEQGETVDYPLLSSKLGVSQGSIRDYTRKITSKGIKINKEKLNNKRIILHIPTDLKKIASLATIMKLREI